MSIPNPSPPLILLILLDRTFVSPLSSNALSERVCSRIYLEELSTDRALASSPYRSTEDFSYFTLLRPATENVPATSLFGISCTRQMDASQLLNRPPEVTRSTVQKAVVVIADTPQHFGMLRERLGVVTKAWFEQREFTDIEILRRFQESLADEKKDEDRDQYLGMNLRVLVHEFKWQTLVLLKCCLLQPKVRMDCCNLLPPFAPSSFIC